MDQKTNSEGIQTIKSSNAQLQPRSTCRLAIADQVFEIKNYIKAQSKSSQQNKPFTIKNVLPSIIGQTLKRQIVIDYNGLHISILDDISLLMKQYFNQQEQSLGQEKKQKYQQYFPKVNCNKKIQILKKEPRHLGEKRDLKNIVKNIIKLFKYWVQQNGESLQADQIHQLKQIYENISYNNKLIIQIIGNRKLNKLFWKFLNENAVERIEKSKISDKRSHYEAIQSYKSLIEKEMALQNEIPLNSQSLN